MFCVMLENVKGILFVNVLSYINRNDMNRSNYIFSPHNIIHFFVPVRASCTCIFFCSKVIAPCLFALQVSPLAAGGHNLTVRWANSNIK